ncbi:MAG: hypothetical protein M1305_05980, partial [Candidatus Marsarchaeota archaeon]|nr:hypothetical protein [Candidatus Marsarchaeota archaeon]
APTSPNLYRYPTATPRPTARPIPKPDTSLRFPGAVLCKDVDEYGRAISPPTSEFIATDPRIYVTMSVSNWKPGGTIEVKWFDPDGRMTSQTAKQDGHPQTSVWFWLESNGRFVAGKWKVEVYAHNPGEPTQQLTLYFTVYP